MWEKPGKWSRQCVSRNDTNHKKRYCSYIIWSMECGLYYHCVSTTLFSSSSFSSRSSINKWLSSVNRMCLPGWMWCRYNNILRIDKSLYVSKIEIHVNTAHWYLSGQSMEHNQIIHFRAEFTIEQGKIEEYKKQIQEMSRMVEANEPDTINYQIYLNKDETKCIVSYMKPH